MDLRCTNCGEPWEIYYVQHEDPEAFERGSHGEIVVCSCCHGLEREYAKTEEADNIRELHANLGDDLDGIAGLMEDFGL